MFYSYDEALDYLQGFINLEHRRLEQYAPENYSLDRPAKLLEFLGSPQLDFPSIHIAGTKGKGSVAAMCAAILRSMGLKVGLYTSPHLLDFRDRIRVITKENDSGRIDPDQVVKIANDLRMAAEHVPNLTWYELVTAMAFRYFSDENVDIAVVEVGLGGRLDATNILLPLVSVITSLSLDHTYLLGDTIEEIATEKGGIIKPNVPVVSAPQAIEAEKRLVDIARTKISPFTLVGRDWDCRLVLPNSADAQLASINGQEIVITHTPEESFVEPGERFTISLMGYHQVENALVALAAMNEVRTNFPKLTTKYAHMGLAEINWPGRLQTLTQGADRPTVLVDCAHNVDSAEKLALALKENYRYQKLFLVLGVTADKDVAGIMEALLPHAYQTFLTASTHPRACALDDLLGVASELGQKSQISENVADAFQAAWKAADPEDLICVTGSIFVVGDLLNQWEVLQSKVVANGDRFLTGSTDLIRDH